MSVGAINLGKTSVCSKDVDDGVEKTTIYDGIGRVDYTFEPHFDVNNVELLNQELYPISHKLEIYGITDNTALNICDKRIDIIKGDLFVVHNDEVKKV